MSDGRNSDDQDFGAILAAFEQGHEGGGKDPDVGERVTGTLLSIGRESAFVDLGGKAEGMVDSRELLDDEGAPAFAPGDSVTGVVTGRDPESGCLLLRIKPGRGEASAAEIAHAQEQGIPVEGKVTGTNKGGLEVEVAGLAAFCPVSQIELGFVQDPSAYVGRKMSFKITRFEPAGRGGRANVVLSRRALLAEEAAEQAAAVRATLEPGKVVHGTVSSLTHYGAFVDLGGGVEGLLHVSEMSHRRVEDPKELFSEGQQVEVQVTKIDGERISLSQKALQDDPWKSVEERFPTGSRHAGRVVRLETFGAFVELAPGLEGLVHVSELGAERRVSHAREVVELGQDVEVVVLGVEPERRRISLSRVSEPADAHDFEEAAKRSEGTGSFGAMADFFKKG